MTPRPHHPTLDDIAGPEGTYSMIGSLVVLGRPVGRWQRFVINRSSARVIDWRFPPGARDEVAAVAAGLARLHALTTGISSWVVWSGELEVLDLWLPSVAVERLVLDLLLADIGDPTGVRSARRLIDEAVDEVNAPRLVKERRRIAGGVVDRLAVELASATRW